MYMSSSMWKVTSLDNSHLQLVIKSIIIFQERNQMVLNRINRVVVRVIGQSMQMDVQSCFASHRYDQQIL